eukprot:Filipodium_phascolosomae@DN5815_c0_g1_i1.p1
MARYGDSASSSSSTTTMLVVVLLLVGVEGRRGRGTRSFSGCTCVSECQVPADLPQPPKQLENELMKPPPICEVDESECSKAAYVQYEARGQANDYVPTDCVCAQGGPIKGFWDICGVPPLKQQARGCPSVAAKCLSLGKSVPPKCDLPKLFLQGEMDSKGCATNPCFCLPPKPPCPQPMAPHCRQCRQADCVKGTRISALWFPEELGDDGCPTDACLCVPEWMNATPDPNSCEVDPPGWSRDQLESPSSAFPEYLGSPTPNGNTGLGAGRRGDDVMTQQGDLLGGLSLYGPSGSRHRATIRGAATTYT